MTTLKDLKMKRASKLGDIETLERKESVCESDLYILQKERTMTTKGLIVGSETECKETKKRIAILDERIKNKAEELEGYRALKVDAEAELAHIEQGIKDAQLAMDSELDAFVMQKQAEKKEELKRKLPEYEDRLKKLWLEFCCLLGEKMVDEHRTGESLPQGFMARVADYPREQGYPRCNLPGYLGQFLPHAVLKFGTQKGGINSLDVARARAEEDKAKWAEQWHKEKGN